MLSDPLSESKPLFQPESITERRDHGERMKPLPAPNVPGNTEAERFDNAVRKMFTVSKEALLQEEAKQKRARERRKSAKKSA